MSKVRSQSTVLLVDRSGREVCGPWVDLWRLLFTYSGVWRSNDKPDWYVRFPDELSMMKGIVKRHWGRTVNKRMPRAKRIMRIAALLCCHGKCKCGEEAVEIVGKEIKEVRPVCETCLMKHLEKQNADLRGRVQACECAGEEVEGPCVGGGVCEGAD